MKKAGGFLLFFFLLFLIIIIPVLIVNGLFFFPSSDVDEQIIINVYKHKSDQVVPMSLNEYLKGVVAAEMPAIYGREALKAQAVAARTYALRHLERNSGNDAGDISTDFRYNQAWISREEMKEKWGFLFYFYFYLRVSGAVEMTAGEILTYNNQIIDAVYHSNSGGYTESSGDVWGQNKPYLISVDSPYDSDSERNYHHHFVFLLADLADRLGVNYQDNDSDDFLEIISYNESGSVALIKIAEKELSGHQLRNKLHLPSAKFSIEQQGDLVKFEVFGFGHGVGMSQDGANGFARHGFDYRQILAHYYPGTELIDYFLYKES